jgi:hypothetical protein
MIEVPAVIDKADIQVYARLSGCANDSTVTIQGIHYPPGTLRFRTFAGRLRKSDMRYHGVYQFERISIATADSRIDFSTIPALSQDD